MVSALTPRSGSLTSLTACRRLRTYEVVLVRLLKLLREVHRDQYDHSG